VENKKAIQYVDIEVTNKKFKQEIQEFKELEDEYRKRGVLCTDIDNCIIRLIFSIPHIKPSPIVFAVELDYSNWDVEPPSVMFIDPFTKAVLKGNEVGLQFFQWNNKISKPQPLLVGNDIPFLCIPGIREYHEHPHHSGDQWMRHRTRGEGKLADIIEKLIKHSISLISGYLVNVNGNPIVFNNMPIGYDLKKIQQ